MMIDAKNLLYSTFIGLHVEIANSSQRRLVGLKGKVVDETKNLIIIEKADGTEAKLPKVSCTFRFTLDNGTKSEVDGSKITFRPHERAKKV
jgi:ribonuclease P protein subunit POP4